MNIVTSAMASAEDSGHHVICSDGSMQAGSALRSGSKVLIQGLQRLGCWVLAVPMPAPLHGQCCDRLRPRWIARALELELRLQLPEGSALVDWRWEQSSDVVSGVVLQANRLQHFCWIPSLKRFALQPLAVFSRRERSLQLVPTTGPSHHLRLLIGGCSSPRTQKA
jgi:hypothetical protein